MKKYLITGLAAVAISGMFTSCTHDTDAGGSGNLGVVETYEQAFISRFGTPSPDADWGFGPSTTKASTRALGDYDSYKGNWSSSFKFPEDCDASKFLAAVPDGVQKMPADGEVKGGTYYIDNTTTKVNMNTGAGVIYVDGTVDLSSDNCFEITQNTEIYLVKGSKFIIGEGDANKLKAIIYIESTATFETAKRLKMDNTSKVYNHGTINAGAFEVNNTSFLYNVGTLNAPNGLVYVANNGASIVNDGTIIAGNVEVAGSGHVQNNAEWTVNNTTTVNSNSASWVNNGHWTTNYYKYTAGSENVINNCFLEVKEDFDINLGDGGGTKGFKIDAGGGVLTKNFNGGKNGNNLSGPYRILMGSKAVFKVTGTAALASANVGTWQGGPTYGYGFYGVGDDYAVFQATHIVKGAPNSPGDKKVQYGGKLYVSAEDHFASELDQWNQCVTFSLGFTKENIFTTNAEDEYSTGKPSITIKKTPCNPGFGGSDPSEDVVRVIAEDMGDQTTNESSDFDFNDVVFDVEYVSASEAKVTILAAGGTLPLTVGWDGTGDYREHEVHNLLGYSETMIINTNSNVGNHKDDVKPKTITVSGSFVKDNLAVGANTIPVKVRKNGVWYDIVAPKGRAAGKLCVGTDYEWCNERQDIYNKWSDENGALFLQYVNDPNTLTKYWYRKSSNYKK